MCSRYKLREIEDDEEALEEIIALLQRRPAAQTEGLKTSGEIAPTDVAPVIARSRRGETSAFAMRWGYRTPAGLVINARSETAQEKPLFADGMLRRRCLIPASCYFEWERRGREKVRYAIRPQEAGLVYMAGLYRPMDARGAAEFVVLTRDAAEEIAFIHPRMPVMLTGDARERWLDPACDAKAVLDEAAKRLAFGAA